MKQVLQSLKTGETSLADIPSPQISPGNLLIETKRTLISTGTERMLIEFGKAGYLQKAQKQPDKVKLALDKIKTDGLLPTIETVLNKLDKPLPMGYCNVGKVSETGDGVVGFAIGDRVASNGKHAEITRVPVNLCAKIPDQVSDDEASFTVIGAIALQSVRLLRPTIGEYIVVTGLGLVGLMCVQILRANGCQVLGVDFDSGRCEMARQFGAQTANLSMGEDPLAVARQFSMDRDVDGVIVAASTKDDLVIHQAASMCRQRGRIILVGVAGLNLRRDDFFQKELTFQVSASYGPGRYDPNYEEKGQDYPIGFVRWTEQRNFEAILNMMATDQLNVKPFITHRFHIDNVVEAYELVAGQEDSLGIILEYPGLDGLNQTVRLKTSSETFSEVSSSVTPNVSISVIGSGNYASAVLIPAFNKVGVKMNTICSSTGVSSQHVAKKYCFDRNTTDV